MKKIKYLIAAFAMMLIFPLGVFASEEVNAINDSPVEGSEKPVEPREGNDEVKVYLFWGNGCSYCNLEKEFFAGAEEEYGHLYEIVDYETWEVPENAALMNEVIRVMDQNAEGVPFTVIGNKSWIGFTEDFGDEMIDAIVSESKIPTESRYDVMNFIDEEYLEDTQVSGLGDTGDSSNEDEASPAALVITLIVIGGIIALVIYTRKNM